ncbi:TolC family protein [Pedobacter duraquae]|uniref:Outer membrane efflux protein n=1 Tax=Pedobacter duraquae TaxID=425511 RepID=A0A4R6IP64_9SPHI|nr:TolC family protein [Pedobacter duraquae]TDO24069.1 outer membrane efflux protein [Pedobacter duraquae]
MSKPIHYLKITGLSFFLLLSIPGANAQENVITGISNLYIEKLIATAKQNYPRLKQFESQVKAAKSDLSGAKISWLDPFSFQYVRRSNDANSTNTPTITTADVLSGYQFGFSFNPGTLFQKPSQVNRAKEQVKIAEYNQAEYNLSLEAEVKRRYYTFFQSKALLVPINSAFLDAENNYKVVKIKYQRAEVTIQEYNTASMSYTQANEAKIQSEINYLAAKAALEELTVKKLEEIK